MTSLLRRPSILGGAALLAACLVAYQIASARGGEPPVKREVRTVAGFTAVELGGAFDAEIRIGASQKVERRGEADMLDRITTEVNGGELVVRGDGALRLERPIAVRITVPRLSAVEVKGSGHVKISGLRDRALDL